MNDLDYLLFAYQEAEKAFEIDEVPVGAIIVKDNQIIASAHNLKESLGVATKHAEMIVIEMASKSLGRWNLNDCIMFITLEPCSMCTGAIINSRLKKIVYGARDEKTGALGGLYNMLDIKGFNCYPEVVYLENENCSKILKDYFKLKRVKN